MAKKAIQRPAVTVKQWVKKSAKRWLARCPTAYRALIRRGYVRAPDRLVILRVVRPGDVVVDAGANVGAVTELCAAIVGKTGEVHAFEPVPPTFARLRNNIPASQTQIRLNNVGLGDQEGSFPITVPGGDFGQASLRSHAAASWQESADRKQYDCRLTTLDQYGDTKLKRLDFLKIDVEGAELLVLRGGSKTLKTHRPVIYLEINPAWTRSFGYAPADLMRFLMPVGYDGFYLIDRSVRAVTSADDLDSLVVGSADLLCFSGASALERAKPLIGDFATSRWLRDLQDQTPLG